jgi:F420-dependent oxidoreductase-like protein
VHGPRGGLPGGRGDDALKRGLSLASFAAFPPHVQAELIRAADRLGYETLWVAEAYSWDAFTQLGWIAGITEGIKLASGIVNIFSRSPALIAQSAATIDRISNGRCVLGLGASGPRVVSGWHGVPFEHIPQRLRETVDIIRLVLARRRLTYEGKIFRLDGGIKLVDEPVRPSIPIYLATLGPQALRLTGEIADGWLGAFCSPQRYAEVFAPYLRSGMAARSGNVGPLATCVTHLVAVGEDQRIDRDALRPYLALYVGGMGSRERNIYNLLFRRYGFVEEADRIQRLFLEGDRAEAAAAVTDEMIDTVAICGPAAECRERLEEVGRAGIDEVALQLVVPQGGAEAMLAAVTALAPR